VPVIAANQFDNSAIDEGPASSWTPPSGSGPAEAAYFGDVTIGAGRTPEINTADGLLYYSGTRSIDEDATIKLDGDVIGPAKYDQAIKHATATIYGDWDGSRTATNAELAQLYAAIAAGPDGYRSIMDVNGDGELTAQVEVSAFLANMAVQPPPECGGGELLLGEGGAEGALGAAVEGVAEGAEPVDVAELAAWLIEQLPPEELADFVAVAGVTAAERADEPVGADLAELLFYLQ
jgi:hypothetical protein